MSQTTHLVDPEAAGQRLDVFLGHVSDASRSHVAKDIAAGHVQVNGKSAKPSTLLEAGDEVSYSPSGAVIKPLGAALELEILYEDADLLVINKPAGISTHPGAGQSEATVADFAVRHTSDPDPERPGIVHRLDKDTSGALIIAKSAAAKELLQNEFRSRDVHKSYVALVIGRPSDEAATIDLPIDRDPSNPMKRKVLPGGKPATTTYTCTKFYPGFTLVEAQPATGRTHQLRVHFAAIGHPIAGDTVYGPAKRQLGLTRQFLHAQKLEFTSPSGEKVLVTAPLPPELANVLQELEASV